MNFGINLLKTRKFHFNILFCNPFVTDRGLLDETKNIMSNN